MSRDASHGLLEHPRGRRPIFLGDLCDRGPANLAVLRLVLLNVHAGRALMVRGNHDDKLGRYLSGRKVKVSEKNDGQA